MAGALTLPGTAAANIPQLQIEIRQEWPSVPLPSFLAAQIEQESLWKTRATLDNRRNNGELGAGLGQFTKTRKFDAISELKAKYPSKFKGWGWSDPYNVTYQLRGVVIKNRDNFRSISWAGDDYNRLAFTDAAYNSGLGNVMFRHRLCANTKGCNAALWFGNAENTSTQSHKASAGYKQSFADITKTHVRNVLVVRRPKYEFMDKESN